MTDTTLLALHRQKIVALEAENAALTRQRDQVADQAQRYAVETIDLADRIAALTREVAGLREALRECVEGLNGILLQDSPTVIHDDVHDILEEPSVTAALSATTDTKETTDGD